jgi:hypothetical protein
MEISAAGAGCGFVIDGTKGGASDGTVKFTYTNRAHQVKVSGGNLHVFNVNGCVGLVANGDPVSLTAASPSPPRSPSPARDLRPADGSSRTGCGSVWQSRSESPMGAEHTSTRGGTSAKPQVK